MKNVRDSLKLFRFNLTYMILFELIIMAGFFAVLIPLYYTFVDLAVNLSGVSYLTKETVGRFFRSPSTYALIFIMFLVVSMYIMINVSGLSYAYRRANYLRKTSPFRMLMVGIRGAFRMLRPKNMVLILAALFYLPVIGTVLITLVLLNIKAPYAVDIVSINAYVTIAAIGLYLLLVLFSLRYIFVIHVFNVDKVTVKEAVAKCNSMLKGKRFKVTLGIILWCLLIIGVPALLEYYYTGAILDNILKSKVAIKLAGMVYEAIQIVFSVIYSLTGLPLIGAFICNSYYNVMPEENKAMSIDDYEEYDARKSSRKERKIFAIILVLMILVDVGFYVLKRYNIISINADYMNKVKITAHRGDSKHAPENTLAAFETAIENGADVIELDVREAKDGEIVVMHDENVKRVSGEDGLIGKMTYEEIKKLNVAAKYKGKNKDDFEFEGVPTLREAIELVGDRAEMNIELKPAKTDKDFEKKVAEIIDEYDYYDNCVVASLTYKSIKKIKKINPEIKTIYVMSVAMGDFYNLEYADGFSIKHRFINNEIIRKSHKVGKDVYAWTVDDKKTLENMMVLNVDNIITNNPDRIRRKMYENYYGDTLIERLNLVIGNQL